MKDEPPPVTPTSIADAKADAAAERLKIFQDTGVRFDQDGHLVRYTAGTQQSKGERS